jgi:HAD superfamily hydrolase (TIGR01549 family)
MCPYTTVIFDFDGTLVDSLSLFATLINQLAPEFNYPQMKDPKALIREHSARTLIKQFGISLTKLPFIIKRFKEELRKQQHLLQPIVGMPEVIHQLKLANYQLGILSSNSEDVIIQFLKTNNIDYFDIIYSDSSIFGKNTVLRRLIKKYKLIPEYSLYIGDEVRDIEAAHAASIPVAAVTWGFNTRALLAERNPTYLIDKPQELITLLAK